MQIFITAPTGGTTTVTAGIPAIVIGGMTLTIEVGWHTETAQPDSASDHQYHPFQEQAVQREVTRTETLNGKTSALFQGPADNGKTSAQFQTPADNGKVLARSRDQVSNGKTLAPLQDPEDSNKVLSRPAVESQAKTEGPLRLEIILSLESAMEISNARQANAEG